MGKALDDSRGIRIGKDSTGWNTKDSSVNKQREKGQDLTVDDAIISCLE